MLRQTLCYIAGALFPVAGLAAANDVITIATPATSMVISAPVGGEFRLLHYGGRLTDSDVGSIAASGHKMQAYPVYGMECPAEAALAVTHADGNMTLKMVVDTCNTTRSDESSLTRIRLRDEIYPFFVDLFYRSYDDHDVIESWVEISHQEDSPVELRRYASAYLPVRRGDVWLCHLHGSGNNESQLAQESLED